MMRVVIIEDNNDNLTLLSVILEKNGCEVLVAGTGREGVELAIRERPDLVLLDIQLPDMNGLEVLKTIRSSEVNGDIPVIAVTSLAMHGDREKMLAAGCDGYIEKPIDPMRFLQKVKNILGEDS